jgi:hypothetical protein
MSNVYNAKALAWQLIIAGQTQPILRSDELEEGSACSYPRRRRWRGAPAGGPMERHTRAPAT